MSSVNSSRPSKENHLTKCRRTTKKIQQTSITTTSSDNDNNNNDDDDGDDGGGVCFSWKRAENKKETKADHNRSVDWTIGLNVNNKKRAKLHSIFVFLCVYVLLKKTCISNTWNVLDGTVFVMLMQHGHWQIKLYSVMVRSSRFVIEAV